MSQHKQTLREIAKFATGLIVADFIVGLWFISSNTLPKTFFGIEFSPSIVDAWLIFDLILIASLAHYAWHAEIHTPSASQKNLFVTIGFIMGIIAFLHLLRIALGVNVSIGSWNAPFWLSDIGTLVATYLSYASFKFASKNK